MISCCIGSVKPSIEVIRPSADITPPPGTPGAATMVTPSMNTNGANMAKVGFMPLASMIPIEPSTRQMVSPLRLMVAHSGTTKSATSLLMLLLYAQFSAIGIVDADDWVPSAVKYAGATFFMLLK